LPTTSAPADAPQSWPVRTTRDIWRGEAPFAVRRDALAVPDSEETFDRLVVEHPGAVVVLALDEHDRALVLEQYRHPLGLRLVQLPAGLLDKPDEDPLVAARRELLEEGALEAEEWTWLATMHTSPGICSERIEVYLAQRLGHATDRGGFEPEHEEADMTAAWVGLGDLIEGVLAGRVTDGPLQVAVLALTARRAQERDGRP
jgi:8-oxo-dGDP phosphatase